MAILEKELVSNLKRINNNSNTISEVNRLEISDEELASIDKEYCTYGDKIPIIYKIYYRSGSVETIQYASMDDNIKIDGDCVNYYDYELLAKRGKSSD